MKRVTGQKEEKKEKEKEEKEEKKKENCCGQDGMGSKAKKIIRHFIVGEISSEWYQAC